MFRFQLIGTSWVRLTYDTPAQTMTLLLTLSYLPVQSSLSWPSLDPFLIACSIKAEETQLATVTELSTLMAAGTTPISFDDAEV